LPLSAAKTFMTWTAPWTRGQRLATAGFWLLSAAVVVVAIALLIVTHRDPHLALSVALFGVLVAAFALLAGGSVRGWTWVLWLSVVILGFQIAGVIGSLHELASASSAKGKQAHDLFGIDPTLALLLNLAVSALGFLLFLWLISGYIRRVIGYRQ
jgi:hypothetical protein